MASSLLGLLLVLVLSVSASADGPAADSSSCPTARDRLSSLEPGFAANGFWQLLAARYTAPRLPVSTGSCSMLSRSLATDLHGSS